MTEDYRGKIVGCGLLVAASGAIAGSLLGVGGGAVCAFLVFVSLVVAKDL
jgi:hypothetical protein